MLGALLLVLAACGGGSGSGSGSESISSAQATPQACAPNNPYRQDASTATSVASFATEKAWVHSYMDLHYLWFDEIPAVDASLARYSNESTPQDFDASADAYFRALLSPNLTPSGRRKDQFSFTFPTRAWADLAVNGAELGYGVDWSFASRTPPRGIRAAYVHAGSPADIAGIRRGDALISADGVSTDDATVGGVAVLNAATFPTVPGSHRFGLSRSGASFDLTLSAVPVMLTPVQHQLLDPGGARVGYLLFTDQLAASEAPLIAAVQDFAALGISDLVLDLRYNGGGFLFIASELAYMIAGAQRTTVAGRVFAAQTFNAKQSSRNRQMNFFDTACVLDASGSRCTSAARLPALDLTRVFVLTSGSTCSASEAVINGLRGVGVDVRLIGSSTCGKPYGFLPKDNCGITYFPIEFRVENALGFGDYADGLVPAGGRFGADQYPGCVAGDDLDHALGDPQEGQLATALRLRATGNCAPSATPAQTRRSAQDSAATRRGLLRSPVREAAVASWARP